MRRRAFLSHGLAALAALAAGAPSMGGDAIRDRQTGLDVARPSQVVRPASSDALAGLLTDDTTSCAFGMRHASGGQPLLDGGRMIDMTALSGVGPLEGGVLRVEAGATWGQVMRWLRRAAPTWSIRQKPTVDAITVGGSLAANAHGNAIGQPPVGVDAAWVAWVDGEGRRRLDVASSEPLRALVGGFGLVGVMTAVGLRLQPRTPLRAYADEVRSETVAEAFAARADAGARYGSAMLACDPASPDFLRRGYLVCHVPDLEGLVEPTAPFSPRRWVDGVRRLHADPSAAWGAMCAAWVADAGRTWAFDDVLGGGYVDAYHARLDGGRGADLIVEVVLPPAALAPWLAGARRMRAARILMCEVRQLGPDPIALLRYVTQPSLAVALTVHLDVAHAAGAAAALGRLLDLALDLGGRFHPAFSWAATPDRLARALHGLDEWRAARGRLDPRRRFDSLWARTRLPDGCRAAARALTRPTAAGLPAPCAGDVEQGWTRDRPSPSWRPPSSS